MVRKRVSPDTAPASRQSRTDSKLIVKPLAHRLDRPWSIDHLPIPPALSCLCSSSSSVLSGSGSAAGHSISSATNPSIFSSSFLGRRFGAGMAMIRKCLSFSPLAVKNRGLFVITLMALDHVHIIDNLSLCHPEKYTPTLSHNNVEIRIHGHVQEEPEEETHCLQRTLPCQIH